MSVGGRIIELRQMQVEGENVVRLWVVDRHGDETCVYVRPAPIMPKLGDEVWWQCRKVLFDNDNHFVEKLGYSFRAPTGEA